jgi:glycosyltransferase involved in cell wall biosynthesis
MVEKPVRILAIVPYPVDFCAGQRFRIELWAKYLAEREIEIEFLPFASKKLTDILYQPNQKLKKGGLMIGCFFRQLVKVLNARRPDIVFIYREAALIGPPVIEKLLRHRKIPIVYDIDEPHFVPYVSPTNGHFNKLRFFSKFDQLLKMSTSVFAVNEVIGDYARGLNNNVEIVPMTVDINRYKPNTELRQANDKPRIAWVGTWSNQPNIELAVPAMRELRKEHDFTFRIIADTRIDFEGLDVDFIPWAYDIEVPRLQESDIGVIPVKESNWSKWKFFFKTIQFMGLGMPVVAAATGSNLEIIKDGVNGFLADNEREWYEKLKLLVENPDLRQKLGNAARKTVVEKFDIERQVDFLESKFRKINLGADTRKNFFSEPLDQL